MEEYKRTTTLISHLSSSIKNKQKKQKTKNKKKQRKKKKKGKIPTYDRMFVV